jgi:allophanate hydrolase subunit 2
VSPIGDRTGLRLAGTAMPIDEAAAALVSAGVLPGALQLPPSGLPIVLLADAPTVGGYPVPAMVASADQPVVAQRQPGDVLTFVRVTAREARSAAIARRAVLAEGGVQG